MEQAVEVAGVLVPHLRNDLLDIQVAAAQQPRGSLHAVLLQQFLVGAPGLGAHALQYDSDDDKYEMLRRKRAIEELAATLETGNEQQKSHTQTIDLDEESGSTDADRQEGFSQVAGYELDIEEDNMDDMPAEELEEAEREMSLEELIEELEATTRKIKSSDLLESTGNDLDKHL